MARLGELLLQERLITPAQLEEALETQVVHGGRLGTNLVEHGFLPEADLARVLGAQHKMAFASGVMTPDPHALKVAEPEWLDEHEVLPMRIDATRLTVAVLAPDQLEALDALGFKSGKRPVPVIIPEFRMNQLLRQHCKAFRPVRPIDLHTLRPSKQAAPADAAKADPGPLIDEAEFAKIYAKAMGEDTEEVIEGEEVVEAPTRQSGPRLEPVEAEPPAVTFGEAQALLQRAAGREDIARVVLRFAKGKFTRTLLLAVRGDVLLGWHGMGGGVTDRVAQRVGVSLREQNTFQLVRDLRSHFVGPMRASPSMEVFFTLLGGAPKTAVVMPLLVRGKVVNLLYLDNGPGALTPADVGELTIVSQAVTRGYETLIHARKAAGAA